MRKSRAQSTFEFTVLTTVIVAALIVMGLYLKRGLQGRWRASVDDLGEQYDPAGGNGTITYFLNSSVETRIIAIPVEGGVWTTRMDDTNMIETRSGTTRVTTP